MASKIFIKTYKISEIPDPSDTGLLGPAEGDVNGKIQAGFEQLLYTLAHEHQIYNLMEQ